MNHPIPFALKLPIVLAAILAATLAYTHLTAPKPDAEQQGARIPLNDTSADTPD